MKPQLTYSEAIARVLEDNGGAAHLSYIYEHLETYRKMTGKTPEKTIQERLQRDERFTRIGRGIYALTEVLSKLENNDTGVFEIKSNQIVFLKKEQTEAVKKTKIRLGQNKFRSELLKTLKACPITGIDDKRLLIASHIKPWVFSTPEERLNPLNGLLLSPLFDRLFDKSVGLITFTPEKYILISDKLSPKNRKKLGIPHKTIIKSLPVEGREEFLEFHRKYIFQG